MDFVETLPENDTVASSIIILFSLMPMKIIFTRHAAHQATKRNILKEEVIDAITTPDNIIKKHGKQFFQKKLERGMIEACCERTERHIKVITVYLL